MLTSVLCGLDCLRFLPVDDFGKLQIHRIDRIILEKLKQYRDL